MTDEKAIVYLKSFPKLKPVMSLKEVYPAASDNCIDLLTKMLVFNPAKRITIDEAINHVYFDEVRD